MAPLWIHLWSYYSCKLRSSYPDVFTSTVIPYKCYKVYVHILQSVQDPSLLNDTQDIPNPQELYL